MEVVQLSPTLETPIWIPLLLRPPLTFLPLTGPRTGVTVEDPAGPGSNPVELGHQET